MFSHIHLIRHRDSRNLGRICIHPQRYSTMMDTHLATNAPQAHPIHVQQYGFLPKLTVVPFGLWLWCKFTAVIHKYLSLAACYRFACSVFYFSLLHFGYVGMSHFTPSVSPLPIVEMDPVFSQFLCQVWFNTLSQAQMLHEM